jgi:diguanylate cyclase (GGDEF)-like protein
VVFSGRLALVLGACGYTGVFVAFVLLEQPGLGIGHFFYAPILVIALATDALWGAGAGLLAAGLYAIAVVVDPRIPSHEALTTGTGIRVVMYTAVGALVGLYAARNRELVERLREHATHDFVTGVANVRAFDEEIERRCADDEPFTLVLFDIDELRTVNDVHGHQAGDAALRRAAAALRSVAEPDDLLARVGGDEFALLTALPPERVPSLTAAANAALASSDLSLTAAATAAPEDGTTAADLFRKADDRLFTAKLLRANRLTLEAV